MFFPHWDQITKRKRTILSFFTLYFLQREGRGQGEGNGLARELNPDGERVRAELREHMLALLF